MTRRFALAGASLACVLCLVASFAAAAEDVLKLVPESASGFVVVRDPTALDAKLQAFGEQVQAPIPSLLLMLKIQGGIQEGLDEKGNLALIILPPETDGAVPIPVILVPVTDYDKFLKQFNPEEAVDGVSEIKLFNSPTLVRNLGGYAALTEGSQREVLTKTMIVSSEIPAALASWQEWLKTQDVGAVILQPGIKRLSQKAGQALEKGKAQFANGPEQVKAMSGVFGAYGQLVKSAEKEVEACGFGLQIDEKSVVRLTSRAALVRDGKWAKLIGNGQSQKQSFLAGLPDGPFVFAAGTAVSPAAWDAMMNVSLNIMKSMHEMYGLTEEQIDKMPTTWSKLMKGAHSMTAVMGVGKSGESAYSRTVCVMRVDNVEEFMADYEQAVKQYAELLKGTNSPMLMAPEIEKCEVGGVAGLQITIKAPVQLPEGEAAAQQAKMMAAFFGPEGKLVGWLVPADEHTVAFGYVDKDNVQQTIEAIKQGKPGLAGNADVSKTAALLPQNAAMVSYLSPHGAIEFGKQMASQFAPAELNLGAMIPEFPNTPPLGVAVTTAPNEIDAWLVIPTEIFEAVGPFIQKAQTMQRGQMAPAARPR